MKNAVLAIFTLMLVGIGNASAALIHDFELNGSASSPQLNNPVTIGLVGQIAFSAVTPGTVTSFKLLSGTGLTGEVDLSGAIEGANWLIDGDPTIPWGLEGEIDLGLTQMNNIISGLGLGIPLTLNSLSSLEFVTGSPTSVTGTWASGSLEGDFNLTLTTTPNHDTVPEPATLALLGLGLAGVGTARRRKAA